MCVLHIAKESGVRVCVYVCACMYMYVTYKENTCIWLCMYNVYDCMYMYTYLCTNMYLCTYTYICASHTICIFIYIYIYMHTCIHAYIHTYNVYDCVISASMQKHVHVKHIFTQTDTHIKPTRTRTYACTSRLYADTAILRIIGGRFQVFQRFPSSKLVLKTVESCFVALNYHGNGSIYVYSRTCILTYTQHVYTHTYSCTYTFTCIHTYIHEPAFDL